MDTADQSGTTEKTAPALKRLRDNDLRFMGLGRVELPTSRLSGRSYEHESGSEVLTRLPFTNILLSMSRI
jgi:hypothetical protein